MYLYIYICAYIVRWFMLVFPLCCCVLGLEGGNVPTVEILQKKPESWNMTVLQSETRKGNNTSIHHPASMFQFSEPTVLQVVLRGARVPRAQAFLSSYPGTLSSYTARYMSPVVLEGPRTSASRIWGSNSLTARCLDTPVATS